MSGFIVRRSRAIFCKDARNLGLTWDGFVLGEKQKQVLGSAYRVKRGQRSGGKGQGKAQAGASLRLPHRLRDRAPRRSAQDDKP